MPLACCDILGLQACFDNVQRISYDCCTCACGPSTEEIPKHGSISIPWPYPSFQVLIDTHHGHHEWDIHQDSDRIRPIKGEWTLLLDNLANTLPCPQFWFQLEPLLDHYKVYMMDITVTWSDEQVVSDGRSCSNRSSFQNFEIIIIVVEVSFHDLIAREVCRIGWQASSHYGLCTLPEPHESTLLCI